jgi:hypothetical protein
LLFFHWLLHPECIRKVCNLNSCVCL